MKTKHTYFLLVLSFIFVFTSCKSEEPPIEKEVEQETEVAEKSTAIEETQTIDSVDTDADIDTITQVYKDPEIQEAHVEIVKKYGEQWDFCTCIVKSDSVNTALMEASDDDFDKVMERSDFIDNKCKGLLIQPNATPEDRYKHEKKVKGCLDSAKQKLNT
ncbi:hypothetical protein CW751_05890 [Brumimicrobium salinarum]|uniref:DUF4476 domain-containing protein n=1 Tax=Brumimicrobium salinarum TaxID=2058658 RepID=A0A2I0R3G6_9FLAO|nr:hypothetical protein [Brumimicrobium salinarum]PKR81112.1 hypothetical protein CW751_05890 [Brumimicrobium salinarum]